MDKIMRMGDVTATTGLSEATIWRRVNDGSFPAPLRLGGPNAKAVGWRASDVQEWIDNLQPVAV